MGIKVLKGGLLTTVQDLGRTGYRKDGIIVSGAMDQAALLIGNLILGNKPDQAGLECTISGPTLLFETTRLIAITGGDLSAKLNGEPLPMWHPVIIPAGGIVSFGAAVKGCRSYLTVLGGFDVPTILGSQSTYLKAAFGGLNGRALQTNDVIPFKTFYKHTDAPINWSVNYSSVYVNLNDDEIRVIEGAEFDLFDEQSKKNLFDEAFVISKAADRMGYRLDGSSLQLKQATEMLSSAVTFGTVQVTPNGSAILLMADHQTTGGYPRILQVATVDLPKLAQMQSGQTIRFKLITLAAAQEALRIRARELNQLRLAINLKYNIN